MSPPVHWIDPCARYGRYGRGFRGHPRTACGGEFSEGPRATLDIAAATCKLCQTIGSAETNHRHIKHRGIFAAVCIGWWHAENPGTESRWDSISTADRVVVIRRALAAIGSGTPQCMGDVAAIEVAAALGIDRERLSDEGLQST